MTQPASQYDPPAITQFKGEYAWLSNFHVQPFQVPWLPGLYANSAEHAFQATKTSNHRERLHILNAPTAYQAKQRGRAVVLDRAEWDARKRELMLHIMLCKFQLPDLRDLLSYTGRAELAEGNTWGDVYWGMVPADKLKPHQRMAGLPTMWSPQFDDVIVGQNWLGRCLMMTREVIMA